MRLYAISDLHLDFEENRRAVAQLPAFPEDWLAVVGDVSPHPDHFCYAWEILASRFQKVFWVPGNHDLWTVRSDGGLEGEDKYRKLVEICLQYGVITPEDPYVRIGLGTRDYTIAPLFLLYDYSFRPDHVPLESALSWARQAGLWCRDEALLKPRPYPSKREYCRARRRYTEPRLAKVPNGTRLILLNHFPLRRDLIRLRKIPRFSIWCGTRRTEDWHRRFPVAAVVSGHLHMRATDYRDGVRFDEVALGYPRHWDQQKGLVHYLRQILPEPPHAPKGNAGPVWHR